MAQSKAFTDASHSLDELFHALALLESENSSLRGAVDGFTSENAKLRELVRDMWHEGMCECGSRGKCASCEYGYPDRMRELGVEVDE